MRLKKGLLFLLGIIPSINSFIVFGEETPLDTGKISVIYECENTALSGAEISLYKVADITLTDNTIIFSLVDKLSDYSKLNSFGRETLFDDMLAVESIEIAKAFSEENLDVFTTATTSENGIALIDKIPFGMYLVVQTESNGVASDYTEFEPFLIYIPTVDENGEYCVNLEIHPKTDIEKIPETTNTTKPPQSENDIDTPDDDLIAGLSDNKLKTGLTLILTGVLLLVILFVSFNIIKDKKREKKK